MAKSKKGRKVTKCVVVKVKGGRWMRKCPHSRPRFVKGPRRSR